MMGLGFGLLALIGNLLPPSTYIPSRSSRSEFRNSRETPIPEMLPSAESRLQVYEWTGPADKTFKGRKSVFKQLEDGLGSRNGNNSSILLVGPPKIGKSSVISRLPRRLGSGLVSVIIELRNPQFSEAADATSLLYGLAVAICEEARRRGTTLPEIDRYGLENDPYPAFGRWLEPLSRLWANTVCCSAWKTTKSWSKASPKGASTNGYSCS